MPIERRQGYFGMDFGDGDCMRIERSVSLLTGSFLCQSPANGSSADAGRTLPNPCEFFTLSSHLVGLSEQLYLTVQ